MQTIEIDEDVFAYLVKNAQPFVDTPNSTLRRLLGIHNSTDPRRSEMQAASDPELDTILEKRTTIKKIRSKAPKANLVLLQQKGVLKNGQKLHLIDYQGHRVPNLSASISDADLIYNGQRYSMSELARKLLRQVGGFRNTSYRGPAHWVTDDGKSIKDLWQQHLDTQPEKSSQ